MSSTFIQDTEDSLDLDAQRAGKSAVALARAGDVPYTDPNARPDRRPIKIGEVWENPVTREYAKLLELPWQNLQGRGVGELIALAGARVMGEHYHPALSERFTPLEGELTVKCNGKTSILRQGETAIIEPGVWHDWWNATGRDVRVRVEITPGERFVHMIETFFGLARLGHTDSKGMPHPLQLALCAREFGDVIVFRRPPRLFSACDLRCAWTHRPLAWLSRDIPLPLAHGAGAAELVRCADICTAGED